MTFWEWLGFENPRDSPQPETPSPKEGLPQITDNVRDSGQTFVFGRSKDSRNEHQQYEPDYQLVSSEVYRYGCRGKCPLRKENYE